MFPIQCNSTEWNLVNAILGLDKHYPEYSLHTYAIPQTIPDSWSDENRNWGKCFRNIYSSVTESFYVCWTNLFKCPCILCLSPHCIFIVFTSIILVCDRSGGKNWSFSTEYLRSSELNSRQLAWEEREAVSNLLDRWVRIELSSDSESNAYWGWEFQPSLY